jgi:uncharacterized protein YeaO (DUF488 family)
MPVTITLNDELATLLQAQALAQRVPFEHWALSILGQAAANSREVQTWASLNQRRFALIAKKYSAGLDEAEECELTRLQETVAELLEPWDRALGDALVPYETLAAQLPK